MARFADMFVDPDADPRTDPPAQDHERATITAFLRWQRDTLELKCSGLDAADLARRSVEVSTLSLLGLVRHMADVERGWFRRVMAGQDAPPHFSSRDDPGRGPVSLRWVLLHMVEEYARHNGHADLLRQAIDGAVGQ
jgi:uncharacterized damage-inducible protein DinB